MYRGVFGSHVACVFRRLFRLCALYGSNPQVVCCSATIQNPEQHFRLLIPRLPPPHVSVPSTVPGASVESDTSPANFDFFRERSLLVINQDGAPTGEKFFCLWNPKANANTSGTSTTTVSKSQPRKLLQPPSKRKRKGAGDTEPGDLTANDGAAGDTQEDDEHRVSTSSIFQSAKIFSQFMEDDVHTILFCRGRKLSELVLMSVHSILSEEGKRKNRALLKRVSSYRGGYTLEDRRSIERRLFSGDLLGVIATNALELGIDVGELDCTMHLGLPSSVASLWQQAGRAGRKHTQQSIAVLVCFDSPLDQHFARHATDLFSLKPEAVALNPSNVKVLGQHLLCAARESTLYSKRSCTDYIDSFVFGQIDFNSKDPTTVAQIVTAFVKDQKLMRCPQGEGGGYRLHSCIPKQFRAVNLRSIAEVVYQVCRLSPKGVAMESLSSFSPMYHLYPGHYGRRRAQGAR